MHSIKFQTAANVNELSGELRNSGLGAAVIVRSQGWRRQWLWARQAPDASGQCRCRPPWLRVCVARLSHSSPWRSETEPGQGIEEAPERKGVLGWGLGGGYLSALWLDKAGLKELQLFYYVGKWSILNINSWWGKNAHLHSQPAVCIVDHSIVFPLNTMWGTTRSHWGIFCINNESRLCPEKSVMFRANMTGQLCFDSLLQL